MHRESSFRSVVVLGVREGQPMCVVNNRRREIDAEERVAPKVVRQFSPPTTQVHRE
jgi:hypothetical protein